ncbi:MAG TPA: ATP-binding protein [Kofleriaceae bacterium]|jgi:PAS domain S-box-containing protein
MTKAPRRAGRTRAPGRTRTPRATVTTAKAKRPARTPAAQRSVRDLEARLREAEDTLDAIRNGHVDALVVCGPAGDQVFTLKGADHRYRQLVETMNEGALVVDGGGLIVYGNARFAELIGERVDRMIGTPLLPHIAEASRPLVDALLQTRGGAPAKAEVELVARDGGRRPVYVSVAAGWDEDIALSCVIVTDLTDQKRNQEMLAAERLTAQIVDQATEGVVVCDLAGIVVRASRAAQRITAGPPLLRPFGQVFPLATPDDPAAAHAVIARALAGATTTGQEVMLRRDPREPVDLLLSAGPITNSEGEVLGCVISFVDITDRKRAAEDRLRLLQAATAARIEAETANRAKDEFLAMLGHELRNPLAPILTALELMNLRSDDTSRRERDVIARQVKHVVTLVGDLLDVSRIAQGKVQLERKPVELTHVVDKAIEAAAPLIEERRHRMLVDVPAGLWLDADETRICQVISNLLTNAAKYTPEAGTIAISAARQAGELAIVVRDSGMGIPPELLPNLFDLFVQGRRTIDRAEGGLGLGLAIVRSLVELHGGSVQARSDGPHRGSEFEVRLPALTAGAEVHDGRKTPPPGTHAVMRDKRVLVVDDNVDAADLLSDALESLGYQTRTAYDGPSALEAAVAFDPDIALLDIGLPAMDGYELARRLRSSPPSTKPLRLIAITGYGRDSDRVQTRDAGFDAHMVKPINLAGLDAEIRSLAS